MPSIFRAFLFVAALLGSTIVASAQTSKSVNWNKSYNEALKLAKETGKPVLIDFWASWCPPCKKMDQEVWSRSDVITRSEKFICVSVDIDRNLGLAAQYRADPIPTLVFADPWGNELSRHVGYLGPQDMTRMMEGFPADFSKIDELNAVLETDKKNPEALAGIAYFYREVGALDISNRYLDRALKSEALKADPAMRERLLVAKGLNHLKLNQPNDARKSFEQCLKENPDGSQCDMALLGLLTVQINQGKIADAEKTFELLKSKFPDSAATQQAARNLQMVKKR